jgi:hypothetical protein
MITRHPPGARVALVHEWLASRAGSEKTFEQMTKVLPDADVYALTVDSATTFDIAKPVHATVLQRIPMLRDKRNLSLPVMPLAWKSLRTPAYDTVVTSSHAFARYLPAARTARVHLHGSTSTTSTRRSATPGCPRSTTASPAPGWRRRALRCAASTGARSTA